MLDRGGKKTCWRPISEPLNTIQKKLRGWGLARYSRDYLQIQILFLEHSIWFFRKTNLLRIVTFSENMLFRRRYACLLVKLFQLFWREICIESSYTSCKLLPCLLNLKLLKLQNSLRLSVLKEQIFENSHFDNINIHRLA